MAGEVHGFNVRVDVLGAHGARSGRRALDIVDGILGPSTASHDSDGGSGLDDIARSRSHIMLIARWCEPQVRSQSPAFGERCPESFRHIVKDLLAELHHLEGRLLAMQGLVWSFALGVHAIPVQNASHVFDEPPQHRVRRWDSGLPSILKSGLQSAQEVLEGLNRALSAAVGGGLSDSRVFSDCLERLEVSRFSSPGQGIPDSGLDRGLLVGLVHHLVDTDIMKKACKSTDNFILCSFDVTG